MARDLRRSLLILLALTACAKGPTPAPAVTKAPPAPLASAAHALPAGTTPTTAPAAPLPAVPTSVQASAGAVDAADTRTPTEASPAGLADAPWLLDRASAWLRARVGETAPTGAQLWTRRGQHGVVIDTMTWDRHVFSLQTLGSDLRYQLDARGCTVHLADSEAACDPELARVVYLGAALTGLTWPDLPGRTAWLLENMRANAAEHATEHAVELRLVLPTARLRVTETVLTDGTVKRLELLAAHLRLEPSADGFAVTDRGLPVWTWSRLEGRPQPAARTVLRMSNLAGAAPDVEQWQKAATQRGLWMLTQPEVQVDVRDDALRLVWVQAPVIAEPEKAAFRGAEVLAVTPPPVERVVTWKSKAFMTEVAHLTPGCHVVQPLGPSMAPGADGDVVVVLRLCQ